MNVIQPLRVTCDEFGCKYYISHLINYLLTTGGACTHGWWVSSWERKGVGHGPGQGRCCLTTVDSRPWGYIWSLQMGGSGSDDTTVLLKVWGVAQVLRAQNDYVRPWENSVEGSGPPLGVRGGGQERADQGGWGRCSPFLPPPSLHLYDGQRKYRSLTPNNHWRSW